KLIESTPIFATGLFGWLIGYRLLVWWGKTGNELPTWKLLALSGMIAALTFIAEAIALGVQASVSPLRVLESAFDFDFDMIRPGWLFVGAGLVVVVLHFVCARFAKPHRVPRRVERPLAAWEVGGLVTLEDTIDIRSRTPDYVDSSAETRPTT